jgi:hypothetical protein
MYNSIQTSSVQNLKDCTGIIDITPAWLGTRTCIEALRYRTGRDLEPIPMYACGYIQPASVTRMQRASGKDQQRIYRAQQGHLPQGVGTGFQRIDRVKAAVCNPILRTIGC